MKIVISSESTIDLSAEQLARFKIHIVPFSIVLGSQSYLDGIEMDCNGIFKYVKESKQLPKTSAVNQFQYQQHFEKLLKEYDAVIHIAFSSELSSAYRNAVLAANELKNVFIIDSRSLSSGIALLAIYASELVHQGKEAKEIVDLVSARVNSVQASFVIQNVEYLYKGGRCSKIAFLGANIFHICPQIIVANGKMEAGKKYRGKSYNVINQYVDDTLTQFNHPDLSHVFVTDSGLGDEENNILDAVEEKLVKRGFKNIHFSKAGCTIASHCGPNCFGILYINDK